MKSGLKVMEEHGIDMSAEVWSEEDFQKARLPMVVQCRSCTMTMGFPSCSVDGEGYTYCSDCSGD